MLGRFAIALVLSVLVATGKPITFNKKDKDKKRKTRADPENPREFKQGICPH